VDNTAPLVETRIGKVVGLGAGDDGTSYFAVLDEVNGDRHLSILIGPHEAVELAASLQGLRRARPFAPQLAAELVRAAGASIRRVRVDRLLRLPDLGPVYGATVEMDSAAGRHEVDARPSDALNLAAVVGCPLVVTAEILDEGEARRGRDGLLRRSLDAEPMRLRRHAG
jgi:bifunctional DNase/RNase